MNEPKRVVCLSIAGLDPSGGAGILADIKTFSAFGCFGTAAVTSVTFQNTRGVFGAIHQTAESVRRQIGPILDDLSVSAAKTGMLPTADIIETVAEIFRGSSLPLVVDPVVRSTSGFDLIDNAALRALVDQLFPLALLVTPNLAEAERVVGHPIRNESEMEQAAGKMLELGARNVLIKGGHRITSDEGKAIDRLFNDDGVTLFESEFIDSTATHGTGCVLSAAITANVALGLELTDSIDAAKKFVTNAIRTAPIIGGGYSPTNM